MKKTVLILNAAAFALIQPAIADHGKVGGWHLETKSKLADPKHVMMYMSGYEAMAYKDAYNKRSKNDYCMTPEAVKADVLVIWLPKCTMGPTSVSGQTLQGDFTCTGQLAGSG